MKAGWQRTTLGAAFATATGTTPPKNNASFYGAYLPLVKPPELSDAALDSAEDGLSEAGAKVARTVPPNSILVSCIGNLGKIGLTTVSVAFNQQINAIVPDDAKALPEFMFYQTLSPSFKEQLEALASGTTVPIVNKSKFNSIEIVLPPLPEQQRIVGILDEAFDGIATAKANAEKNLQNARALFESHLQSVFTRRGEGWVDAALGDVCAFVRGPFGGSLRKSEFVAQGYAVYEQQHAICDQFDAVRYFIDEAKFTEMRRFELLPDDLIMSCSGTMGRVAIVPKHLKRGIINQALLKLTPTAKILSAFLKAWMESEAFQEALKEYSGGAAIQNVASVKILKEIGVPLPSIKEQGRVIEKLDDFREETQRLESVYQRKLAALEALKKSLLHRAFTGQL
jgi:type I restriction enzyme S subunit